MTQTITRELKKKFELVLLDELQGLIDFEGYPEDLDTLLGKLADAALEVRGMALALKGGLSIENRIAAGLPIEEDNTLAARKELTDSFERALAFNPLQWCSNPEWARFERFVVDELTLDPDCFARFARERRQEGQFSKRMSNEQISRYPDQFIATWPQYRKQTESTRTLPPEEPKHMITLKEMGIV